jgi:serine/threonine protein kinase/Flp pilus assembly protein TadD
MIGKKILHYNILDKLGEGGMGIVYLAEDSKLKRRVAIKFLPQHISENEEERKRFEIEAQATAALNHPNIATIHSIEESDGQMFFVMEYIEGKELKETIESHRDAFSQLNEVISCAIQIAEGLDAAHKREIIHRDIKSSNIMITNEGKVKIMDFGLAKFNESTITTVTNTASGTPAYMSPEQIKTEKVDHRTDIWSFGVVLYEMLSGSLPFRGEYNQAVAYSIINEEPPPLTLDKDYQNDVKTILDKLLSKNPALRYQKMSDVILDLKNLSIRISKVPDMKQNPPIDSRSSIAVLPFINMSADPEQEYFCDGISEEIINSLVQINNLRVISRTSVFSFKGKNLDAREIGKTLDVNTLLEGSVRKSGNRLRITTQLIKVSDGSHLWSNRYDRVLEDVFSIQEDIAENVATSLKGFLTTKEKEAIRRPETNFEAYEYYLKGRQLFHQLFLKEAIMMFDKAIELDTEYASAYAGLSDAHSWLYEWEGSKDSDLAAAEKNSLKALALAPNLAASHTSRGFVLSLGRNYVEGEKEFKKAIKLNPNFFDAYYLYGRACFANGQIEKSAELFRKAAEVRKEDFQSMLLLSQSLGMLGNPEEKEIQLEGIRRARKQLEINPYDRRVLSLGSSNLFDAGEKEEAIQWINRALELYPEDAGVLINGACLFAKYDKEKALNLLEKAVEKGFGKKDWIEHDPDYDPLRKEPRFQALLTKLK